MASRDKLLVISQASLPCSPSEQKFGTLLLPQRCSELSQNFSKCRHPSRIVCYDPAKRNDLRFSQKSPNAERKGSIGTKGVPKKNIQKHNFAAPVSCYTREMILSFKRWKKSGGSDITAGFMPLAVSFPHPADTANGMGWGQGA